MTGRFFITGLPRSRTAWFSVATTTPSSICFHEPTSRLQSFDELRDFWAPKFGVDIGISDSALAPQIGRILEELKPRTLIIERPVDDTIESFRAYAAKTGLHVDEESCRKFARASFEALGKVMAHPLVKTVSFDALDDYAVMLDAMNWLLPGTELPDFRTLMGFNIQVSAAGIEKTIGLRHTRWHLDGIAA